MKRKTAIRKSLSVFLATAIAVTGVPIGNMSLFGKKASAAELTSSISSSDGANLTVADIGIQFNGYDYDEEDPNGGRESINGVVLNLNNVYYYAYNDWLNAGDSEEDKYGAYHIKYVTTNNEADNWFVDKSPSTLKSTDEKAVPLLTDEYAVMAPDSNGCISDPAIDGAQVKEDVSSKYSIIVQKYRHGIKDNGQTVYYAGTSSFINEKNTDAESVYECIQNKNYWKPDDSICVDSYSAHVNIVNAKNINLSASGGTVSSNGYAFFDGENYIVDSLPTPVREGYVFTGWSTAINGGNPVTVGSTISKEQYLYATWKKQLTVTLSSGTQTGTQSVHTSNECSLPDITIPSAAPTITFVNNDGTDTTTKKAVPLVFHGYYEKENGQGKQYYDSDGKCVNDWDKDTDSVIYAYWTIDTSCFPDITRTGYTLYGWSEDKTNLISSSFAPLTDTTLYCIWNARMYDVTYIDYCDNKELGRNVIKRAYASAVSGSDLGCETVVGAYYPDMLYDSCTKGTVTTNGCTVKRYFTDYSSYSLEGTTIKNDTIVSVSCNATEIVIPETIKKIADNAFADCVNLTKVTLPAGTVTEIGSGAFKGCTKLKSIDLPYSVTKIGSGAFNGCNNLEAITVKNPSCSISASENTIPGCATLYGFTGSTTISYGKTYAKSCKAISKIDTDFFKDETTMTSFTVPADVTEIGENAFKNIKSLASVSLGSVKSIGNNAFQNTGLISVIIPSSVVSIGNLSFADCTELTKLTFADGSQCTSIGEGAFARCKKLTYGTSAGHNGENVLNIPESVTVIKTDAFLGDNGIGQININALDAVIESTSSIPATCVIGCYADGKTFQFADSNNYSIAMFIGFQTDKLKISDAKYSQNRNLVSAAFGPYVEKTADNAFASCRNLKMVMVESSSLKEIGNSSFSACTSLKEVIVPDKYTNALTKIGANAFSGCTKLGQVSTPDTNMLESIESSAFYECTSLKTLTVYNPNCVISSNQNTFDSATALCGWSKSTANDYCNMYGRTLSKIGTSYQIIFDKNGGCNGNDKVYVYDGMKWPDITPPVFTGHTFNGYVYGGKTYYDADGKCVFENQNITQDMMEGDAPKASWSVNSYSVSFDSNGGTGSMKTLDMTYGVEKQLTANSFTKKGYLFAGWNTKADGTGNSYEDLATVKNLTALDNDKVTLYAVWTPITYTVKYDLNCDQTGNIPDKTVRYDEEFILSSDVPVVENHTFSGWNTKADGQGTFYYGGNEVSGLSDINGATVTLYAVWTADNAAVTYDLDGGVLPEGKANPVIYTVDDTFTLVNPEKTGYKFVGWTGTDIVGVCKDVTVAKGSSGNRSYVAHWEKENYSITLDLNGGNLPEGKTNPASYDVDTDTFTLVNPEKTGYEFIGWKADDSQELTVFKKVEKGSVGNIDLQAQWKVKTYNVSLVLEGGYLSDTAENVTSYTFGQIVKLPSKAVKDGSYFAGWSEDQNADTGTVSEIAAGETGDKTYYAVWRNDPKACCNIHYMDNDIELTSDDITDYEKYSSVEGNKEKPGMLTLPTEVSKTGYTFNGWYDNKECTGEKIKTYQYQGEEDGKEFGTLTFYAKFTPNTYDLKYMLNGGVTDSELSDYYVYGKEMKLCDTVSRSGYEFAGWYDNEDCNGTALTKIPKDATDTVTLYAKWSAAEYSVTLYTNEGTIHSNNVTSYTYGTETILPDDISRTGCTFGGWYDNKTFQGDAVSEIAANETGDKVYYAKWIPNTYHISYVVNGGTFATDAVSIYSYNTKTVLPTDITRDGYTFGGWYTDEACTDKAECIDVMYYGNKTFYAKWNKNETVVPGTETTAVPSAVPTEPAPTQAPTEPTKMPEQTSESPSVTTPGTTDTQTPSAAPEQTPESSLEPVPTTAPKETGKQNELLPSDTQSDTQSSAVLNDTKTIETKTDSNKNDDNNKKTMTKAFKKGSYAYKVTDADKKTVCVTRVLKKSLNIIKIADNVKYKGKTYKITSIGTKFGSGCKKVKKITIGKNVTKIGKQFMPDSKGITNIIVKSKKIKNIGHSFCKSCKAGKIICNMTDSKKYKKLYKKLCNNKNIAIK